MKKILIIAFLTAVAAASKAQLNPVSWSFSSKKIADKKSEIIISASIQNGWHLFSQTQPEDAIGIPTRITFNKNPLLILDGKIREDGKLEKFHDAKLNVSANQYSTKVDFVQTVKLKSNAKTKASGSVTFQTCDDEKCLRPTTVTFNVAL